MANVKQRTNADSRTYTGANTFPADNKRELFFLVVTSGTINIEIGGGGGLIPVAENGCFNPPVIPVRQIAITGTGTYTVFSNSLPS